MFALYKVLLAPCGVLKIKRTSMTNNDIIRRLRYIWDFDDDKMIALFRSAELKVTREEISAWLKREEEEGYVEITDLQLGYFLNGLINDKRGKLSGPQVMPTERISNNSSNENKN